MKDRANALAVSALLGATLFFFTPASIYLLNASEFAFFFKDIFVWLLLFSAVFAASTAAVFAALPPPARERALAAGAGATAALWLQANVLVWDYGVLDGQPLEGSRYDGKSLTELAVWFLVVGLAVRFRVLLLRNLKAFCFFLLLVQAASLGVQAARMPRSEFKSWELDLRKQFAFSTGRNVVILVLDSFQSTFFREVMEVDGGTADLEGFTYFRNATSGYPKTTASVPNILTGHYYDNSVPLDVFVKRAYLSESSLPYAVRRAGGAVHLYPDRLRQIYADPSVVSNVVPRKSRRGENLEGALHLVKLGLFRQSPHAVKMFFFGGTQDLRDATAWHLFTWPDKNRQKYDLKFLSAMKKETRLERGSLALKYYHLWGAHPPFRLTRDLKETNVQPYGEQGFREQAAASMRITRRFLEKLRQLGIYDRTMILVLGDHGLELPVSVPDDVPGVGPPGTSSADPRLGTALPLVLVKPFGAKGPLRQSDAPVCLSDVPATVADGLGLKGNFSGTSMLGGPQPPERERRFYFYPWRKKPFDTPYLPPMSEFLVSGHAWRTGSWKATGRVLEPGRVPDNP